MTPTVPDLSPLAQRKLAELQANGYTVTGYCFERKTYGPQPHRGFVDSWGFVGWWRPDLRAAKDEALIQQLLAALVKSSPHTDATSAWKDPEWARQRMEAINAASARLGTNPPAVQDVPKTVAQQAPTGGRDVDQTV